MRFQGGKLVLSAPVTRARLTRRGGQVSESAGAKRRKLLEGYAKDGVVHLLNGELPEGVSVTIFRKRDQFATQRTGARTGCLTDFTTAG